MRNTATIGAGLLCLGLFCPASAGDALQFDLSAVFNADVVANQGDAVDDLFDCQLLEDGYPDASVQGLPRDGVVGEFILGDYSDPNVVQLLSVSQPQTLVLPESRYSEVKLLVSSGNGHCDIPLELWYADGSSERRIILADDWCRPQMRPGVEIVFVMRHRYNRGNVDGNWQPTLFSWTLHPDPEKILTEMVLRPDHADARFEEGECTKFNLFAMNVTPRAAITFFVRGDVNGSGAINISDPLTTISYLFAGGRIACLSTADSNDDGAVGLDDAIYLLEYLFTSGPGLAAPIGECGSDATPDALQCDSYPPCE